MDIIAGYYRARAAKAAGAELMVFDWDYAARYIRDHQVKEAYAGLQGDFEATCTRVIEDGEIFEDGCGYLCSLWATPILVVNDEEIECFRYASEVPDFDNDERWPVSAQNILSFRQLALPAPSAYSSE